MAMNIKNNDLELLRTVCADLDKAAHSMLDADMIKRAVDLEILVERLEQQRDVARKRTAINDVNSAIDNYMYSDAEFKAIFDDFIAVCDNLNILVPTKTSI